MKYSSKQYAQALQEALETTSPADTDKVLDNFVQILASNNDLRMFEQIVSEFHRQELARKGIKQAELTSAHPLSRENEQKILDELNRLVSSKIELKKNVDENLLGGVVIRVDDKLIDASARNTLNELKKELSQ